MGKMYVDQTDWSVYGLDHRVKSCRFTKNGKITPETLLTNFNIVATLIMLFQGTLPT